MAEKEATVYIVDVGASMAERNGGREVSDLDWAMQYVWDKITTAVSFQLVDYRFILKLTVFPGCDRSENTHNWGAWTQNRL